MAVKMRLTRLGDKKSPFYRIVITDSRNARDGAYIDKVGHYNPTTVPAEIAWKDQVGVSLEMNELDKVEETVAELLGNPDKYRDKIDEALKSNIFNIGESGKAGAKYIYQQIMKRQQEAKDKKKK